MQEAICVVLFLFYQFKNLRVLELKKNQTVQIPSKCAVSDVEVVENFLNENYELRYNVLSHKLEIRERGSQCQGERPFRPFTAETMNSIVIAARKELGKPKSLKTMIGELIHSESTPIYDPAGAFLESLPAWDGEDHVSPFLHRIPNLDEDHLHWLHIWLLSAVAHWTNMDMLHGNECVPTLIGPQGCGKSTFCQRLLPPHLRGYFLDHINLANKFDKEMALTHNLLVNIDELDQVKPGQQANLKQTLSKVKVNGRPIFGRNQRDDKRYASFVATTNNRQPLQDPTGSRRYICIEIPEGALIDNETDIDYPQLYAQLLHELREEKRRYWFTNDETLAIQAANAPYQREVSLDEIIKSCFRKPTPDEVVLPLSLKDIVRHIVKSFPGMKESRSFLIMVGLKLKDLGYQHKRDMNGSRFYAICI